MSGKSRAAAVPQVQSGMAAVDRFAEVVKQNVDWLTGQHVNAPKLKTLSSTATLAEVIEQVNAQRERMERG